jgi:hypothetical protein
LDCGAPTRATLPFPSDFVELRKKTQVAIENARHNSEKTRVAT